MLAFGLALVGLVFLSLGGLSWLSGHTEQLRRRGRMSGGVPPLFGRDVLGWVGSIRALYRIQAPADLPFTRLFTTSLRIAFAIYALLFPIWVLMLAMS